MVREGPGLSDIRHVFIDLDNTLYINDEVAVAMIERIQKYMVQYLRMSEEEARRVMYELHGKYGTSLSGLVGEGYDVDVQLYQDLIHDLEYEELVFPDPELKELLSKITQPKYLFTNGTESHAKRCLERLEMEDLFEGVISFDSIQQSAANAGICLDRYIVCKPDPLAYKLALSDADAQAETTLFIDDSARNITAAKELNMSTLLIKKDARVDIDERVAPSLMHLPKIYPILFTHSNSESPPF